MPEEEHNKMMGQFQEKVFELGFTMKCNNGVYGIYMDGIRVYSLNKGVTSTTDICMPNKQRTIVLSFWKSCYTTILGQGERKVR